MVIEGDYVHNDSLSIVVIDYNHQVPGFQRCGIISIKTLLGFEPLQLESYIDHLYPRLQTWKPEARELGPLQRYKVVIGGDHP